MGISKTQRNQLKILGQRLKRIRIEQGLTQKELSFRIEKELQSISRVELGDTNPSFLYLMKMCEGLGVTINDVLKDLDF